MSIVQRFINIVKTNIKKIDNDNLYLSQKDIDDLLKDDTDDELSKMIADANKQHFPDDILNAFNILKIQPTNDIKLISSQFKNLLNKYHPDKNNPNDKQFCNNKTAEIISNYTKIKNYLIK